MVRDWFTVHYARPTDAQRLVWPAARKGEHLLLTSPTGTGKTLAAFLVAIDALIRGQWPMDQLSLLYVSPLKALNQDIHGNLETPLAEMRSLAAARGEEFPTIRIETRSGDTSQYRRRRMIQRPPEILITTPESLNLLLASAGGRSILTRLRCVILDEIHAVTGNRRGTHLMSAVERLVPLSGEFQRLALSATIGAIEETARFVAGYTDIGSSRPIRILRAREAKELALEIEVIPPGVPEENDNENEEADTPWKRLAAELKPGILRVRSTLIFVNSRRLAERIAFLLNRDEEELIAYAHHGSLSREIRTMVEERLKSGRLRAIVATNSLELGIDIGFLEKIVLVQTPFSISSAIQKIGRAGHQVGSVSRAILYCSHGRDLLDALALARALNLEAIEAIRPIDGGLDLLAQILVGEILNGERNPEKLYSLLRRSYPYRNLKLGDFDQTLEMLEGYYKGARLQLLPVRVRRINNQLIPAPSAAFALYSSGGTIPDRGYFSLRRAGSTADDNGPAGPRPTVIGELDEEFVWERKVGDCFSFGSRSWRIVSIGSQAVEVVPEKGPVSAGTFFRADPLLRDYRSFELLGELLEEFESDPESKQRLEEEFGFSSASAETLSRYLRQQQESCGLVHRHRIVREDTRIPEAEGTLVPVFIHTLWGGRCNAPLALALESYYHNEGIPVTLGWDNDSILLLFSNEAPAEIVTRLDPVALPALIEQGLSGSGIFGARFREVAGRALILEKSGFRRRTPLWLSRLRSKRLLNTLQGRPGFPLIREAARECLEENFDIPRLIALLSELILGKIELKQTRTESPSPLCAGPLYQQINLQIYADDRPENAINPGGAWGREWAERLAEGEFLRPRLDEALIDEFMGRLKRTSAAYRPESVSELQELLRERVTLSAEEFIALGEAIPEAERERLELIRHEGPPTLFLDPRTLSPIQPFLRDGTARAEKPESRENEVLHELLLSWLYYQGPATENQLVAASPFKPELITAVIAEMVEEGELIRDYISAQATEPELMHRQAYQELLRFGRARSRQQNFSSIPADRFAELLARRQGVGEELGLFDVLSLFEGMPLPAALWEGAVLPVRVSSFGEKLFDDLLKEREILWQGDARKWIRFLFTDDADLLGLLLEKVRDESENRLVPRTGAFSFRELGARTGLLPGKLNRKIWEEVFAGRIAADEWQPLRKALLEGFRPPGEPPGGDGVRLSGRRRVRRGIGGRPSAVRGNWFTLPRIAPVADPLEELENRKERVRLLFRRYPVIFREILHREESPFRWADLFSALRLMEFSGEVVSGSFIRGIDGLQFARPEELGQIGAMVKDPSRPFLLHVNDPASLAGIPLEEFRERYPPRRGNLWLLFRRGVPVLRYAPATGMLHSATGSIAADLPLLIELSRTHSVLNTTIRIATIDGDPVDERPEARLLRDMGFLPGLKAWTFRTGPRAR